MWDFFHNFFRFCVFSEIWRIKVFKNAKNDQKIEEKTVKKSRFEKKFGENEIVTKEKIKNDAWDFSTDFEKIVY